MKKSLALFISAALLVSFLAIAGCGQSTYLKNKAAALTAQEKGTIKKIKEKGYLTVGIFTDKPPFGYVSAKGQLVGFDTSLAKRFAKDLLGDETKVKFVHVEPAGRISFLQSNKVDIIMANMTVTDARKDQVDFTNPYMKVAIQVLANDKENIRTIDDLNGKRVIVVKGTTADTLITGKYPEVNLVRFDQNLDAFQALKDGRGAAIVHDNLFLFAWANINPGFSIINEKIEDAQPIAAAVKKGNTELRDWVNEELRELAKENYLHQLYEQELATVFGFFVKSPEDIILEGGIWQ